MDKQRKIVLYGSLAAFAAAVCLLIAYFYVEMHEHDIYDRVQDNFVSTPEPTLEPAPTAEPTSAPSDAPAPSPTPEPYTSPVDFDALREITPNIYAWIRIPGTSVDYPIVQHPEDDDFYLRRAIDGQYNNHGSIYSEASVNGTDFSDYHTILYGHNFEDDTMFSSLTKYRDRTFFQENNEILIYTPETELHYRIVAAVTFSNAYIPYYYDGEVREDRQVFLEDLATTVRDLNNNIEEIDPATADDKLLILSTCTGNSDSIIHRYLVVAVLTDPADSK